MAKKALTFMDIRDRAEKMVDDDGARVSLYQEMRDMYMMEWSGQPSADWIRKVVSPDAYDTVMGIVRLMIATEPVISVPGAETTTTDMVSDELTERALKTVLRRSAEAREVSALCDAFISAALFSEVVIRVGNSYDIISMLDDKQDAVMIEQCKRVPYTFDTVNPATVFTDSDTLGMRRIVICDVTTAGAVREMWGSAADHVQGDDDAEVELYDYWDRTWRTVWVKNGDAEIIHQKHGLPFIPIVKRVVQGTKLWNRDEAPTTWPLLYAMHKSGMWDAQNIALTMVYSTAYAMGSVPFIALKKKTPNQADPEIDWTRPGINVKLLEGQEFVRVAQDAVPDDMLQLLNMVESKTPEMLMPKVVFGQSPGGNMSYSAINLLSQGGRLPLIPIQEKVAEALAGALEIVLRWVKVDGERRELFDAGVMTALDPDRIDEDRLWVDVKLNPNIPQDRMQMGTLASQLVGQRVISLRTAREWLHITDDMAETEQILLEQFTAGEAEKYAQRIGAASDIEDGIPEDETPDPMGEGPLFDTGAGGLSQVQAGFPPTVVPGMPGITIGGPGENIG